MRWQGREGSSNVEDRRGGGGGRAGAGIGIGAIVIALIAMLFGQDPMQVLQQLQGSGVSASQEAPVLSAEDQALTQFVSVVLKDNEDVWNKIFPEQLNQAYREPVLVIFDGETQSGCGYASSATGPFYCPADEKLYIDLSFYRDLKTRFGAPGDFAMAYVIAHEVGHHVQHLLGITDQVDAQRGRISEAAYNQLSVRLELQADYLAGMWAHHAQQTKNILEQGDLQEALQAANAIGDDRLQMQAQGYVVPESFTHGTSEQRMRWFSLGYKTGDIRQSDTFRAKQL
ncbi:MAG: neutral zinc metallopeptidase [Bacteroidia bacterium]|nr:neutral zinc metallopeptidase [Bacteroidia bacterium]